LFLGHESEDAEDGEARVEAGEAVGGRNEDTVFDEVVVELVVGAKGGHAAERDRVREENLSARVNPHLTKHFSRQAIFSTFKLHLSLSRVALKPFTA